MIFPRYRNPFSRSMFCVGLFFRWVSARMQRRPHKRVCWPAKRMIALSGAHNVKIEYTGLREGEKLYEEVLSEMENTKPTFHEKIRIAQVREYDYEEVNKAIEDLVDTAKLYNNMDTVRKMKEMVPEYKSNNSVYEKIDQELAAAANA